MMAAADRASPHPAPLSGVTVLDLTQIYNGPYATFLMAMAGAEVIKVEPREGEFLRRRDARSGAGVPFAMLNANKRSIALDLKSTRGREIFLGLTRKADVIVENFAPGVVARLGIGYDTVRPLNARIVYASGSGYGQTGPYREYPAMDLTVQAMSGVMSVTGFANSPPVKAGAALCDFFGGVHLYGAIATALFNRERSGEGCFIDVAMLEAVYPSLASNIGSIYSERDDLPPRTGNRHGGLSLCPYNVYPAFDGFIAVICNSDKHWQSLLRAMDRNDLLDSPRFATMRDRVHEMDAVDALVGAWTRTLDRKALFERLLAHRVPCAPVRELREVVADPHLRARGMLLEVEHPEYGRIVVCRSPMNYVGLTQPEYRFSPRCGADNARILGGWLGLSPSEIEALRRDSVI